MPNPHSFHLPPNRSPAEILATEEALLDYCEGLEDHPGFLTFWESPTWFVVLGYGKQLAAEMYEENCASLDIPILRRTSGGGTVLQGPGCFNYNLVCPIASRLELESITSTNRFVMEKNRAAIASLLPAELQVQVQGHTDLTVNGLKFSGNAQRRKRRCLMFHGSFLLNFDLDLISKTLRSPAQQPDYRQNRTHHEFITNLRIERDAIEAALRKAWDVTDSTWDNVSNEVTTRAESLVREKYSRPEWNRRF